MIQDTGVVNSTLVLEIVFQCVNLVDEFDSAEDPGFFVNVIDVVFDRLFRNIQL
jgi:hypothetical protein